jgi:peptide/nickel transport system substrate-binding protein
LGFNPWVKPFRYNPEKSQDLLTDAGWGDKDNDGILEKEGKELELRVLVDARKEIYKRIIMVIRQQLQEIGIKVKAVFYNDESELTERFIRENKLQAHLKLLLCIVGHADRAEEEWGLTSERVGKLWRYVNKETERLFILGEVTYDNWERQEIYQKIHRLIYEDQPACFLYFPLDFHAISNKFENLKGFFTLRMPVYTMKDWYIRKIESRE